MGHLAEGPVVCHQYRVHAQRMCGNQHVKRRQYLAMPRHLGPHNPATLCRGAFPGQYVDAPEKLAHGKMQLFGVGMFRQAKQQLAFGNDRDAKGCHGHGDDVFGNGGIFSEQAACRVGIQHEPFHSPYPSKGSRSWVPWYQGICYREQMFSGYKEGNVKM